MPTATLTSKGRITIPKPVRDELGLGTGDRLVFRVRDGTVEITPKSVDLMSLYGVVKPAVRGVSIEDMDARARRPRGKK